MLTREEQMIVVARSKNGTPTVWCDPDILDLVTALQGLGTVASCSGHGYRPGFIALADGRVLLVCRSLAEAKRAGSVFPLDINGEYVKEQHQ